MSVPAYIMKARNSAATIAMNATSDYNHFSNQAYGVINVHNREYLEQDPQRPVTAFNTVASFEIDKNHDYTQLSSLKIVTGPATFNGGAAQTVQQFVDGVGYRMLEDVKVSLTNNRLNSVTMPYLWYRIKDLMYYRDETRFKKRENYLADQASAALIAALGAGHTFLLDLDCGYLHESNETMLMISALAARIKYEIRLASHENIVNVGAAAAIATLPITECKLLQDCIHINPSEREAELERYDSDSGLFTLIHKFEVQEEALTSQLGGTITIPITLTGTYECLFIILRPYSLNDGTSTIKDPCSGQARLRPPPPAPSTGRTPLTSSPPTAPRCSPSSPFCSTAPSTARSSLITPTEATGLWWPTSATTLWPRTRSWACTTSTSTDPAPCASSTLAPPEPLPRPALAPSASKSPSWPRATTTANSNTAPQPSCSDRSAVQAPCLFFCASFVF
jgi:hypothetical protein